MPTEQNAPPLPADSPHPPLGIVTGLEVEARILAPLVEQGVARVGVAHARPRRAAALAEAFAAGGARALMSFGICGGLTDAVRVGDLVLVDAVIHPESGARYETHVAWRERLQGALGEGIRHVAGSLVGSPVVVDKPHAKRALSEQWKAVAVDMESHAVAEVAARHGLPFMVLRTCSDAAARTLPLAALSAMSPGGRFKAGPILKTLASRPWLLPPLLRLGRESGRALKTLKRLAAIEAATKWE